MPSGCDSVIGWPEQLGGRTATDGEQMMEGIRRQLEQALEKGCLVALYRDPVDWSRCQVGFVDGVASDAVRLRSVTSRGDVIGYEVHSLPAIKGVGLDDGAHDYLDRVSRLVGMRQRIVSDTEPCSCGIGDSLREAMASRRIVTVIYSYGEGDALCGVVHAMTEGTVGIRTVDQFGEDDGLVTASLDGVTAVYYGTEDEQILDYLRASYAASDEGER